MKRQSAISPLGYSIAIVIVLGLVMILSAPLIVQNNITKNIKTETISEENSYNERYNDDISDRRLDDRVGPLENKSRRQTKINDKYVCKIEGGLEDGIIVPINPNNPPAKFIFSCEYFK